MISIVPAIEENISFVQAFFGEQWNKLEFKQDVYNFGRFIEINEEKLGFFVIIPCNEKEGWLRSLYFKQDFHPGMIMLGIDWILEAAHEEGMNKLFAFSHSPNTDAILLMWKFELLKEQPKSIVDKVGKFGSWWQKSL
jgi:hypothetical protein